MASAAVLAAATAASGQYAELGAYDQRYYSVTSAASLFRGSLNLDDEVVYTYVEQRTGTYDERSSTSDVTFGNIKLVKVPSSSAGFDFLAEVSEFALYGQESRVAVDTDLGTEWLEPFKSGKWTSKDSWELTYTVEPSLTLGGDANTLKAEAKVYVHNNWLVEVVVHNTDTTNVSEQFSLYMAFQGKCNQKIKALDEKLGETVATGGGATNTATVTEQRTTEVTWQLVQLSPGGGFASNG